MKWNINLYLKVQKGNTIGTKIKNSLPPLNIKPIGGAAGGAHSGDVAQHDLSKAAGQLAEILKSFAASSNYRSHPSYLVLTIHLKPDDAHNPATIATRPPAQT